jgi:hypothetical protein
MQKQIDEKRQRDYDELMMRLIASFQVKRSTKQPCQNESASPGG